MANFSEIFLRKTSCLKYKYTKRLWALVAMQLKQITTKLFNKSYEIIFKEKMSVEVRKLFLGTSYVAVGTLVGVFLTFIFNALAARIIGPTGFGNLALVTSVALCLHSR